MIETWPNHVAAANVLSVVRSMGGRLSGRMVRPCGGHEAVADLIRQAASSVMEHSQLFSQAVRECRELPADVRAHVADARGVEESCFDESYIAFLDEQIHLSPRGPEWTEILRRRREGLRSFCGVPLLSGHIRVGRFDAWVKVDPRSRAVVFWEQLEYDDDVA